MITGGEKNTGNGQKKAKENIRKEERKREEGGKKKERRKNLIRTFFSLG